MPRSPSYDIQFDKLALDHMDLIEPKFDSLIQTTIEEQLPFEPLVETRNRKRLARDTVTGATWEVRCGPNNRFRIFYKVDVEEGVVLVIAIVIKVGNVLYAGRERFEI